MLWFCDLKQNGTPFGWKSGSDPKTGTFVSLAGKEDPLSETKFNRRCHARLYGSKKIVFAVLLARIALGGLILLLRPRVNLSMK